MKIIIRSDSVTIEGYVNAVERNSKPLNERGVTFIEKIGAGAFARAIKRAKDIRILLNHDWSRDLGGIKSGNLELEEDNIGLRARAVITDPETIEDARRGNLTGWSFGFLDKDVIQMRDDETGLPLRKVNDLILEEVSLLNRSHSPAYAGTLVNVREIEGEESQVINIAEAYVEDIEIEEPSEELETRAEETAQEEGDKPEVKEVSSEYYARYKNMISELKELVKRD